MHFLFWFLISLLFCKAAYSGNVLILSFSSYGHIMPSLRLGLALSGENNVTVISAGFLSKYLRSKGIREFLGVRVQVTGEEGIAEAELRCAYEQVPGLLKQIESQHFDVIVLELFYSHLLDALRSAPGLRSTPILVFSITSSLYMAVRYQGLLNGPSSNHPAHLDSFVQADQKLNAHLRSSIRGVFFSYEGMNRAVPHALRNADCIVSHSCRSFYDSTWLDPLIKSPAIANIPFIHAYPDLLNASFNEFSNIDGNRMSGLHQWLGRQLEDDVIYVSFGTLATPNATQIAHLFQALRESKRPFVWSLKAKFHHHVRPLLDADTVIGGNLGSARGVIMGWVDQPKLLKDRAISLFVSHCGWNSVLESIQSAVPVLCIPQFADQLVNALFLESKGAGKLGGEGGEDFNITDALARVKAMKHAMIDLRMKMNRRSEELANGESSLSRLLKLLREDE